MATYKLFSSQLKGQGILNSFEIPAGVRPEPVDIEASSTYNYVYNATLTWSEIRDALSSPSNTETFALGVSAYAGRGDTTFIVSRSNIFFDISSFESTVTGLTLNITINGGTFAPGSNIKVFDGGVTELMGDGTEYPLYLTQGSVELSDPVFVDSLGTYNISLNSTAIDLFNERDKARTICVIAENDYNNSEPSVGYDFNMSADIITNPITISVV